jgi:hypothetical protein
MFDIYFCESDVATGAAIVGPQGDARSGLLSDYAVEEPCADGTDHCIISITDAIRAENGGAPVTYQHLRELMIEILFL